MKKFILFLMVFLILIEIANASILDKTQFYNITKSQEWMSWDWRNITLLYKADENLTTFGYNWSAKYTGENFIPAPFTNVRATAITNGSFVINNSKLNASGGTDDGISYTSGVADQYYALVFRDNLPANNAWIELDSGVVCNGNYLGFAKELQVNRGSRVTGGNCGNVGSAFNSTSGNKSEYLAMVIDSNKGIGYLSNTSSDIFVFSSTPGLTYSKFLWDVGGGNSSIGYIRIYSQTAGVQNISANRWQKKVSIAATQQFNIFWQESPGDSSSDVTGFISCNNGSTWFSTTTNNSNIDCGQVSQDIIYGFNLTGTNANVTAIYLNTQLSETPNITITATDLYDGSALTNFSVNLSTGIFQTYLNTTNGTIPVNNVTNGFYNITFFSNQNGGYFSRLYDNILVNGTSLQGQLFQSLVNLYVNDTTSGLLVNSFTLTTNFSGPSSVSGGYILLSSKAGKNNILNITVSQYPNANFIYPINALDNISFVANLSPIFNFYLRREADNSIFDVASTNSTILTIYCPLSNIIVTFRNSTYNSTSENASINCPFSLMKMDVSYASGSYFRTLIPSTSQQNVTWWLLDLNKDTAVQQILQLNDLTGTFTNGILRIKKAIGGTNEKMIEQYWDIATQVTLYLLKDGLYTVSLINSAGQERQIGSLIADAAGTKTIVFPNLPFYNGQFSSNLSWTYYFNTTTNILRFSYSDLSQDTQSIQWDVYNSTNLSDNLLNSFTSTSQNVTFTYQPVYANTTYLTNLRIINANQNITEIKTFGDYGISANLPGFEDQEGFYIKLFASIIILIIVVMLFSARYIGMGLMLTSALAWVFKSINWFPINALWLSLISFVSILTFVVTSMRQN